MNYRIILSSVLAVFLFGCDGSPQNENASKTPSTDQQETPATTMAQDKTAAAIMKKLPAELRSLFGGEDTAAQADTAEQPRQENQGKADDIPLYPGARQESDAGIGIGSTLSLVTHDSRSKVLDSYRQSMTSQGWTLQKQMDMGIQNVLIYEKQGRAATMVITEIEEGETRISITTIP